MDELVRKLHAHCEAQPYHTSWHLHDLRTGKAANRHGDQVLPSASTRKIAIMMTTLERIHGGELKLDQPFTIEEKFQDNNSGTFQHFAPGGTVTLGDAITMMIIVSDNTCTGTIADMLGLDAVNEYCRRIGMTGTAHRMPMGMKGQPRDHPVEAGNATTTNDLGMLLNLILAGIEDEESAARLGCTVDLCRLALDILSRQRLQARLPFRLPAGTRVAHKTGTGKRNVNDAGIIFDADDRPLFILSVITDGVPVEDLSEGIPGFAAAQMSIQEMARMCYDDLS